METPKSHEETKTLYEKIKLTRDEICQLEKFKDIKEDELEHLQQTVFNLSWILLKINRDEST